MSRITPKGHAANALIRGLAVVALGSGCGQEKAFDRGEELAPAVLGGGGGGRVQSGSQVSTQPTTTVKRYGICKTLKPLPLPTYNIVPVTQIVEANSGIPGWSQSDLPFTGAPVSLGMAVADGQTPFSFSFDYPANNFQLSKARLVMDTARDNSDTEGIFVEGIFTGRPPTNMVNLSSPKLETSAYFGSGASSINTYYIDFSLSHYKRATRNTFDLEVSKLLLPTAKTEAAVLADGEFNVVAGDDSPVYQAYLVIKGLTATSGSLTCSNSSTYTFTNVYLHNDGNTVGEAAFTGTVGTPSTSFPSPGTYPSLEFNYDAPLPQVDTANISITNAKLAVTAKRVGASPAAIVINGIGVSETGFDRSTASAAVERWDDTATAAFESFVSGVSTNVNGAAAELDLLSLFDATTVRGLLAQGKLNVSVAGRLYVYGQAATSTRGFGVAVAGPELKLDGTYFTQLCQIPNNPDSPLTQSGVIAIEPEYEEVEETCEIGSSTSGGTTTVLNDGAGPVIGSLQALEITSTAATIVWSTDEASTTEVRYGIGNTNTSSGEVSSPTTFHQVRLTGLIPYKFYSFQVISVDTYGNASTSDVNIFTTLR